MLNIKKIALKVAKEMRDKSEYDVLDLVCNAEPFAEALVAELANGNEQVGYYAGNGVIGWLGRYSMHETKHPTKLKEGTKLYALPPTTSQIEQETAEAIASYLTSGRYMVLNPGVLISAEQHIQHLKNHAIYQANAIRSGAWKEFKK